MILQISVPYHHLIRIPRAGGDDPTIVVTSAIIYTIAEKRKEATNDDSLQLQNNRVNG